MFREKEKQKERKRERKSMCVCVCERERAFDSKVENELSCAGIMSLLATLVVEHQLSPVA